MGNAAGPLEGRTHVLGKPVATFAKNVSSNFISITVLRRR